MTFWPIRYFLVVQSLSHVQLFATPWAAACQASLSFILHCLVEFTQTHAHRAGDAIHLAHPLASPSPPAFNLSQHQRFFPVSFFSIFFSSNGQSVGASASASVLPVNIQSWFPLGISLYCPTLSHSVVSDSLRPHGLYSSPGSSVHGILQARILEWVAMPSSRGSSQPRDQTQVSRIAGGFFTIWATKWKLLRDLKYCFLNAWWAIEKAVCLLLFR